MSLEVVSLGCRLNLSESEAMRGMLAGAGDIVVVNSCAVTSEAERAAGIRRRVHLSLARTLRLVRRGVKRPELVADDAVL